MKLHYSTMSSAAKKAYLLAHPTCPICGGITNDIDHAHPTDLVRDALCHRCNCRGSSLERALMIPTRRFQTLAGDLHRGYARTGRVNLARFADDLAYRGLTEDEYRSRFAAVHAQLTQRYVYWTEATTEGMTRSTTWTKTGPLLDEEEAQKVLHRLQDPARVPPHLYIVLTLEPDDGVNSPFPRGLAYIHHTPGAMEYIRELRRAEAAAPQAETGQDGPTDVSPSR
ncbi:hypothetical protein [Streptomyces sp. Ac-502]|uniref:hypothetical protein n=1 Tax=Streptomyces sp. Ac-502 TaxID=3342801 RepID=UPI0038626C65